MKSKTESVTLPKGVTRSFTFWQDREIRFDAFTSELKLRKRAEVVIAKFSNVEDTKGNNGYDGTLLITNLRLIWFSTRKHQVNLSIGLHTIQSISKQETESKLFGGVAESLHIPCRFGQKKFHFIFTAVRQDLTKATTNTKGEIKKANELAKQIMQSKTRFSSFTTSQQEQQEQSNHLPSNAEVARNTIVENEYNNRLYHTVQFIWKAYDSTQLYRELRVRSATIINDDNVVLLSGEQVLEKMSGVSHVSNDEGFIGTLVITNLRLVWFATQEQNFNISLPYLHIIGIHCQHNKFGPTLTLQTSSYVGSVVIAFRISPVEKLKEVFKIITSFWKSWAQNPILGMNTNALINSNLARPAQNQNNNSSDNKEQEKQWQSAGKEEHNSISESNQIEKTGKHKSNNLQDDMAVTTSMTENTMEQTEDNTNMDYNDENEEEDDDDGADSNDDEKRRSNSARKNSDFDAFALYYENEWQRGVNRRPVYDDSIGLAVEKLKEGDTIQDLWTIPLPL